MNAKPTRMLFAAVALSALAAALASSAYAAIPEGNGTKPPSRTVVHEDALAALLASSAYGRIQGNGTQAPSRTVVKKQQAAQGKRTFYVDAEICAALDRAIRVAIQECSHAVPNAANLNRTGTDAALAGPASAELDNRCYGQLVSGINTTWPWAHFDEDAFPLPPGAIALWVQLFGRDIGVDSVRELQLRFCGE